MAGSNVGGGRGSARRQRSLAEINVTPLVDVMLVLLIISMVATPMMERGINLELPKTSSGESIDEARTIVSLDREGRIRVNNKPLHLDLLGPQMEQLAAARPEETVFLRADKLLAYGEVLLIMDTIRQAGIERVSLVTVPLEIVEKDEG